MDKFKQPKYLFFLLTFLNLFLAFFIKPEIGYMIGYTVGTMIMPFIVATLIKIFIYKKQDYWNSFLILFSIWTIVGFFTSF